MKTTKFRQAQVFDMLKATPGLSQEQLAERCGGSRRAMAKCLQKLCDRGLVERQGNHRARTYVVVPGAKLPKDRRGSHPNSRASLRLGWYPTRASLQNLRVNRGIPKPKATTALEQCWGWGVAPIPAIAGAGKT